MKVNYKFLVIIMLIKFIDIIKNIFVSRLIWNWLRIVMYKCKEVCVNLESYFLKFGKF